MSSPSEFGETAQTANDVDPTASDPTSTPTATEPGVFQMLFATDAGGRAVDDIMSEYDLESRGIATILLGVIKMAGTGGFPAALDLLAGFWLTLRENASAEVEDGESDFNDDGPTYGATVENAPSSP